MSHRGTAVALAVGCIAGIAGTLALEAALLVPHDVVGQRDDPRLETAIKELSEFGKRLRDLEVTAAALHVGVSSRDNADASPSTPPVGAASATAGRVKPDVEAPAVKGEVAKQRGLLNPPPDAARLEALRRFDAEEELRRQWIFAEQEEVLHWFGTPSYVEPYDWGEHWVYRAQSGDEKWEYRLIFRHGRMVRAQASQQQ